MNGCVCARDHCKLGMSSDIMDIAEETSSCNDPPPSGDVPVLDREYMIFKKLFRDLRLHTDVGLKLYNAKRKEIDEKFYAVFYELSLVIALLEQHQTALAEGKHQMRIVCFFLVSFWFCFCFASFPKRLHAIGRNCYIKCIIEF